jgi:undecaprenyl diphosphate synthase
MKLFKSYLEEAISDFKDDDIVVRFIGDKSGFSDELRALMDENEECSKDRDGMVLNIAMNYGSRDEITRGVRELAELVKAGELDPAAIDEDAISKHLYTGKLGVPDPDLIIRPGGEVRLSNYLLWQVAYAEMYFCDTLWPDFTPDEYERILRSFGTRERRFGGRNE